MAKLRIIGKFIKDCEIIGYLVINAKGKNVRVSASKLHEMIEKDVVEGARVITDGTGNKYYIIDQDILDNVESIVDTYKIKSRVIRKNKSVIGYKLDGTDEILGMGKIWEMTFNSMIENAEVRLKDTHKILLINGNITTEVMEY
jgi:hypothetical protein